MKTALIILGVLFALVLALVAGGFGYLAYEGKQCDASSKAYVDESIPAIVSPWSKDELLKRESPQLQEVATDEALTKLFDKLSGLGQMKSYDGATGKANVHLTRAAKLRITADYTAQATFEKGKAQIKLQLIQSDGVWKIDGFSFGPDASAK